MRAIAACVLGLSIGCGAASAATEEPAGAGASAGGHAGESWSDEQVQRELDARRDAIADCASGASSFTLDLEIRPSGHLESIAASGELDAMQNQCVRDALAHFDLPGHVESGREHTSRIDVTSATVGTALEAEMRGFLDARRSAILACALEVPLVIDVRWDGTGAVDYHLRGQEATERQRCVIDALASGAPDTAGSSGHIVHELR